MLHVKATSMPQEHAPVCTIEHFLLYSSIYTLLCHLCFVFLHNLIIGGSLFSSHHAKLDHADVPRGFVVESSSKEGRTERGAEISTNPKCLLSK